MCDSRRPLNGADSEPIDRRDATCDQCLRTIYTTPRRTNRGLWLCEACHRKNEERYAAMTGGAA